MLVRFTQRAGREQREMGAISQVANLQQTEWNQILLDMRQAHHQQRCHNVFDKRFKFATTRIYCLATRAAYTLCHIVCTCAYDPRVRGRMTRARANEIGLDCFVSTELPPSPLGSAQPQQRAFATLRLWRLRLAPSRLTPWRCCRPQASGRCRHRASGAAPGSVCQVIRM